ncbi:MAG: hypothetical protein EP346_05110 [Bacteroidetes bacterium]|uniref:DUF304 domain-containing protein n=1 Tax=Phaeocystidibacter marisrubri TaxID=1577780 RepID=A0A6L3ZH21_9FLAO|nr:hypothetical protein [Phaeocystidibacter marisrubri]KAB2817312.1 hypothetical protein F8C82_02670 [Phaeocystidibacter marisrubri]TNE29827.1 MAG: hypothetical protein EP346_05110 [Bacteroidota bacterium]GGH75977.1 hypothetical protein GCM10011318_23550 [Phaeocystidibacter marisrubri]
MRLNTIKRYTYQKYLYLVLAIFIGFDVLLYNIDGSYGIGDLYVTPFVILLVIILIYRGNPVFRYDSDGEVLIVDSKEPFLGGVFRSNRMYEFPKRKFVGYKIKKYPLRRVLILRVKSKESKFKTMRVTISYLTRSEVKDLSRSLESVAKTYKNHNEEDQHDN